MCHFEKKTVGTASLILSARLFQKKKKKKTRSEINRIEFMSLKTILDYCMRKKIIFIFDKIVAYFCNFFVAS